MFCSGEFFESESQTEEHILKIYFRLYQLEVELIDVQDEMVKTKYWLNTNRKRYNDNADKKQTKKRR